MAKKKFDITKYQPSADEIATLAEAFVAYADECRNAAQLMREKSTKTLIVSNWDTVQKALGHIDTFVRQVVPAARFGNLDARIYGLLDATTATQQSVAAAIEADAATGRKKRPKKGETK